MSAVTSSPNQATVSFTTSASNGSPILYYLASSSPGNFTGISYSGSPVVVSGLTNAVSYTFQVYAVNSLGTSTPSSASNAVTPQAASLPLIIYPYTISSGNPNASSATINFNTNIAGTSTINYGLTASYGTASASLISTTSHSVLLTGLSANTTYHYRIAAYDSNGDIATSSDQTFITVVSCNYYVDSINGSDSNPGTDASVPKQNLLSVPAVSNGATICLRRGSTFTDSLYVGLSSPINNVTVRDYGPANLPKPVIDNSAVIASSSWSLVSGTSNLYQVTVSGPGTVNTPYGSDSHSNIWINIWECKSAPCVGPALGGNDNNLNIQNSQALASSTPGSYYIAGAPGGNPPSNQSSFTIYMSPSDGTSPITNGYAYTYSARYAGLYLYGSNDTVINIVSKKNAFNDGSIVQGGPNGGSPTFSGIEADQGGKHNMLCSSGCTVSDSSFNDEYYGYYGNMLVVFDSTGGQSKPFTCNNCSFIDGLNEGHNQSAFYTHAGSGPNAVSSLTFNGVLIKGDVSDNFGGISGSLTTGPANINGLLCDNISTCLAAPTGLSTNVAGSKFINSVTSLNSTFINFGGDNSSLSLASSSYCGSAQNAAVYANANNLSISVATSTFFMKTTGGALGTGGGSSYLHVNNSIFDNDGTVGNAVIGANTNQYVADNNVFTPNIQSWFFNSVKYTNLFAWQSTTSQDVNSVTSRADVAAATTTACTIPTFTFSGPSSGNVNGASSNFTITPNLSFTGTTTINMTGSGSAGLTPITLTFNNSTSPQTFNITPTATGTITLTPFISTASTMPSFEPPLPLSYLSATTTPSAPYGPVTATAGNTTATILFSAPASNGGLPITSYTVISSPGNISTTTTSTTVTMTGLTNGQAYTFTVTATNAAGTGPGSNSNQVTPFTIPGAPTGIIATAGNTVASVTFTAAPNNGSPITGYTVFSSPAGGTDTNVASTTLTHLITGLTNGQSYTFTVTATNIAGTGATSTASNSITPSTVASVSTNSTTNISTTTATLNGSILSTGGSDASQTGFAYSTDSNLVTSVSTTTSGAKTGMASFSNDIANLIPNQTYYVRAYAVNVSGTTTGSILSFLTLPLPPAVSTISAAGASANSISVSGNITATNGVNASSEGFVYGTTGSYGATTTIAGSSFGTGVFNATISSLACGALYHVAAFAVNTGGTTYGSDATTTTAACPVTPTVTTPTISVSSSGGSVSASTLASILAPGPATTAYLKSLMNALVPVQGCPIGFICKPKTTTKNQETITKQTLVNNPQAPVITSATFTRSIQVGATGKDVKILQKYLNSQGYTIATTGPGSLGHETDLFGNLTKQALKTFQKAHGLPATGFFGPLTQKVVNSTMK